MDSRLARVRLPRGRLARALPAVAWAAYVLFASVVDPGGAAAGAGTGAVGTAAGGVAGAMAETGPLGSFGFDKWLHAGTYATLAFLAALALSARTGRLLLAAGVVAVAFGAGMEIVQYPLPARSFDVADMLANAVGAVLGVGVWWIASRLRSRFTRPSTPHEQ